MGEVVPIRTPARRRKPETGPPPDLFDSEQLARLLRLAHSDAFTYEQVAYAWQQVKGWHAGNPGPPPRGRDRADWVMVLINAMRAGWALGGFAAWWKRKAARRGFAHEFPGRPLPREVREGLVEERRRELEQV